MLTFGVILSLLTVIHTQNLRYLQEPAGSFGPINTANYTPKGNYSQIDDMKIYTVGNGTKSVLYIYDIYGLEGSRARMMCDMWAALGYFVIMPDFFRGEFQGSPNFNRSRYNLDYVKNDLNQKVFPYLKQRGINTTNVIGSCWGGWLALELVQLDNVVSGVSFHPAVALSAYNATQLANMAKSPVFLAPSIGENADWREGGAFDLTIKQKPFGNKSIVKFYNQSHGFVPRGALNNTDTMNAVNDAMNISYNFLLANDPIPKPSSGSSGSSIISLSLIAILSVFALVL